MTVYAYKAQNHLGNQSGRLEAQNAAAAAKALIQKGLVPFEIVEVKSVADKASWRSRLMGPAAAREPTLESMQGQAPDAEAASGRLSSMLDFSPKVSLGEVMMFARQLHVLMRSGVPIMSGLASLRDTSRPILKTVLADVIGQLSSGKELSNCLAAHPRVFDEFFVAMVRVGEETGKLDEVFWTLYERMEFDERIGRQIKTATRYPLFVLVSIAVALAVVNLFVIPSFAKVFDGFGAQLPLLTRVLLWTSEFSQNQLPFIAAAGAVAALSFRAWIKTAQGKLTWHKALLKVPLFGSIVLKASLARFCRGMALALSSGVPVLQAISIVAKTSDNAFLSSKLAGMKESIERGSSVLGAAEESQVFPPMVLQMIAVGDQSGQLDDMMNEVASSYTKDVQYELQTFSQRLEPILIAVMGVFVLILALGIFLPIWDLGSVAMQRK